MMINGDVLAHCIQNLPVSLVWPLEVSDSSTAPTASFSKQCVTLKSERGRVRGRGARLVGRACVVRATDGYTALLTKLTVIDEGTLADLSHDVASMTSTCLFCISRKLTSVGLRWPSDCFHAHLGARPPNMC